jgi:PadR family transcriptional regulator, regulatory protein PadR
MPLCGEALGNPPILFDSQYCALYSTGMGDEGQGRKFQKDLNSGLVALVLLAVLESSPEDLYGYEIAKRLQKANEGDALFKEGTIYPVLRTLSATGLLTSRIVPSYSGPPRRYYRITDEGRAVLQQWSGIWRQTRDFVDRFIEGTEIV